MRESAAHWFAFAGLFLDCHHHSWIQSEPFRGLWKLLRGLLGDQVWDPRLPRVSRGSKSDRNRIEIGSKSDRNRIKIGSKSDPGSDFDLPAFSRRKSVTNLGATGSQIPSLDPLRCRGQPQTFQGRVCQGRPRPGWEGDLRKQR